MKHSFLSHEPFGKSEIGINLFCTLLCLHQAALVGSTVDGRKNIHVAWYRQCGPRNGGLERSKVIEKEVIMIR